MDSESPLASSGQEAGRLLETVVASVPPLLVELDAGPAAALAAELAAEDTVGIADFWNLLPQPLVCLPGHEGLDSCVRHGFHRRHMMADRWHSCR